MTINASTNVAIIQFDIDFSDLGKEEEALLLLLDDAIIIFHVSLTIDVFQDVLLSNVILFVMFDNDDDCSIVLLSLFFKTKSKLRC